MQQSNTLKAEIILKWYENGACEFQMPTDVGTAYALLHFAMDEIQERIQLMKKDNLVKQKMAIVGNDGKKLEQRWGG